MVVHLNGETDANARIRQDRQSMSRRKSKYDRALLGRYKIIRTIGTGNFAEVKLAIHLLTGKEVAIKVINVNELSSSNRKKLSREVNLMKLLDHPHIVKLLEIIQTDKMMYLVLEYASGGELYEYLVETGRMKEKVAREKFRQILSAVEYCHRNHIIHRDLKMENLLLDSKLNIKLADFGFANKYVEGKTLNTFCGSPPYAAPELFRGQEYEGPEVDVWSLGVILFKMVTGSLPFDGQCLPELRERILKGKYRIPFYMSTECERLLRKMLILNPKKRSKIRDLMNDTWVNLGYENDILTPHVCAKVECTDRRKVEQLLDIGFGLDAIVRSLKNNAFDEITATYFLLDHSELPKSVANKDEATEPEKNEANHITKNHEIESHSTDKSLMINGETNDGSLNNDASSASDSPVNGDECQIPDKSKFTERVITIEREQVLKKWDPKPLNAALPVTTDKLAKKNAHNELPSQMSKANGLTYNHPSSSPMSYLKTKGVHRTSSMRTTTDNFRHANDKVQIISEYEPTMHSESAGHHAPHDPHSCLNSDLPSSDKRSEFNTSNFSRMSSMRQTVHSAYRPDMKRELEAPGVAGTKGAPIAIPRSNLSKYGADEEYSNGAVNDTISNSSKTTGVFRNFASIFSRRSQMADHTQDSTVDAAAARVNLTQDTEATYSPTSTSHEYSPRPRSELVQSDVKRGLTTERTRFSTIEETSPIPMHESIQKPLERIGSTRSSFLRALSQRFFKRKPLDTQAKTSHSENKCSTPVHKQPESAKYSTMPQIILNSVNQSIPNGGVINPDGRTSDCSEIKSTTANGSGETKIEDRTEPKTILLRLSLKATSLLTPDELVVEVKRVLTKNAINFVQRNKYQFICTDGQNSSQLEICMVPNSNKRGLTFKKLKGTSANYKRLYTIIFNDLNLT